MHDITTPTPNISESDRRLAYSFAERIEALEKATVEFCIDLAEAVDSRIEGSQNSFLTFACPRIPLKTAQSMVVAGREAARAPGRPGTFYGWATYEVIASIPEEHKDWAYEQPRSFREIQAFKKQLKQSAQPATTHHEQPERPPVRPPLLTVVPDLAEVVEATVVESGTCIPVDTSYEQQQGTNDYNEFIRLQAYLCQLLERNAFTNRMSPEQWHSIRGGLRPLVEIAEVQSRYTSVPAAY